MAESKIPNTSVKFKEYQFSNLAQYSPQNYYFYITGIKSKVGIPSDAKIITADLVGWSGLGTSINVNIPHDDELLVIFSSGWNVTSASYVTVRFAYI